MLAHPITKVFLIVASGFLLSLSAPGYDLWFLAWFCLSPLFIIINSSKSVRETITYAFLFGFTYNLCYVRWLFSIHPLSWLGFNNFQSLLISLLAVLVTSTYLALFFVLFALCATYIKTISSSFVRFILITLGWLMIFNKLSSSALLLGFPWSLIEYSQYKNLFLIQISEYFGSISIGFLIVFFNLVLADFLIWVFNIEKISNRYVPKAPGYIETIVLAFFFILILISSCLIFGAYSYSKNEECFSNSSQSTCIVQGNLPIKLTRGKGLDIKFARKTYNDLIKNTNASLVITPEGSLPSIFNKDPQTQYWLKTIAKKNNANIICGSYCKSEDLLTNCAVAYEAQNKAFRFYEKERLVPFGEFVPLSAFLPGFLKRLASNVVGDGFSSGKENHLINSSFGKIGVNICFELIFPTIIRKHSLQGAKVLVNLSDLSWFSDDLVKQQFLAFGVFRAIENRKPLIIATNSGIGAFIEPSGKIKNQSLSNTQGVLLDWVNPNDKITFYAKYGW